MFMALGCKGNTCCALCKKPFKAQRAKNEWLCSPVEADPCRDPKASEGWGRLIGFFASQFTFFRLTFWILAGNDLIIIIFIMEVLSSRVPVPSNLATKNKAEFSFHSTPSTSSRLLERRGEHQVSKCKNRKTRKDNDSHLHHHIVCFFLQIFSTIMSFFCFAIFWLIFFSSFLSSPLAQKASILSSRP